jgi:hypothetical protein
VVSVSYFQGGESKEDSMSDTPSGAYEKNQTSALYGASVKLRGMVEQVISSPGGDGSEVVQVVIEDAEPLYREIRIRNHFHDANGNAFTLQVNSEVEITIKVRTGK